MIALLDTHSFLWAVVAPEKLSAKMRGVIADPGNEIHVSTISFWEIALKYSLGKIEIAGCATADLVGIGRQMGPDDFRAIGRRIRRIPSVAKDRT